MINNKRAAMEMSVGTIVTIVLLMSVLVLGMMLVTNIFGTGQKTVDEIEKELTNEVQKLLGGNDFKATVSPASRRVVIKQEDISGVGIGIRNKLTGSLGDSKFSYIISVSDPDLARKCGGIRATEVEGWITTGREANNLNIPSGDVVTRTALFDIPIGAPLCTIRFAVDIFSGTSSYAADYFDVTIEPA